MADPTKEIEAVAGDLTQKHVQKAVHGEVQAVWQEMKSVLDEARAEVKKYGAETAEQKAKYDAMEADLEKRMDALEAKANRPGMSDADEKLQEQKAALIAYMRKGEDRLTPEQAKALVTDTDSDGGYLITENINPQILEKLVERSPMRELANIETITMGNSLSMPTEVGSFAAQWASERGSRSETTSGTVGMERIPAHELYANPLASQQMLDDSGYDIEAWISRKIGEQIGVAEATAFISGNGVDRPEGVLNGGLSSIESANSGVITGDDILDLVFELPEAYANNGVLLWKRSTTRALRKEKDGQDQYLWAPGINAATPATYAGYNYREAIDMPSVAASAKAVVFADFQRLYTILDRKGISLLRDPFSNKPFVGFYTTFRVGGQVVLPEAGRILTVKA